MEFNWKPPPTSILSQHHIIGANNIAMNASANMSEFERLVFSFVIFVTGISGNASIPSLCLNLAPSDQHKIGWIVGIAYGFVAIFYVMIGAIGYWLYGGYTNAMILNNFFIWPGGYVIIPISLVVISNLWASIAMTVCLIGNTFDDLLGFNENQTKQRKLVRFVVLIVVFIISYLFREHLAFAIVFTGCFGVGFGLALFMPIVIAMGALWEKWSNLQRILNSLLLVFCILIGCCAAYIDIGDVY